VTMPFVSTPFDLSALVWSAGRSEPTAATSDVCVNMLAEMEAKVAAPPSIRVSVRNGVRVVSRATVPKTVSNATGDNQYFVIKCLPAPLNSERWIVDSIAACHSYHRRLWHYLWHKDA
jgi:hypothetical protein